MWAEYGDSELNQILHSEFSKLTSSALKELSKQLEALKILDSSAGDWPGVSRTITLLHSYFDQADATFLKNEHETSKQQADLSQLQHELKSQIKQTKVTGENLANCQVRLEEALRDADELRSRLKESEGSRREGQVREQTLTRQVGLLGAELKETTAAVQRVQAELQHQCKSFDVLESELKSTQSALDERDVELESERSEAVKQKEISNNEIIRLRNQVAESRLEIDRLANWQDWSGSVSEERVAREAARLAEKLFKQDAEPLIAAAEETKAELRDLQQNHWHTQAHNTQLQSDLLNMEKERDSLRKQLSEREVSHRETLASLEAATQEIETIKDELREYMRKEGERIKDNNRELEIRRVLNSGWDREVRALESQVVSLTTLQKQ